MRQPPKYISTAEVSIGPNIDVPNVYKQYADMFGKIEEETRPIAQSFADQQAKEKGQIDGKNPGFKPELEIGEASRAYNQAGLAANKMATTSMIDTKMHQYQNEAMGINSDGSLVMNQDGTPQGLTEKSISEFNSKASALSEGVFGSLPAENRPFVKSYFASKSTLASSQLITHFRKQQNIQQNLDLYQNNSTHLTSLIQDSQAAYATNSPLKKNIILSGVMSNLAKQNQDISKMSVLGAIGPKAAESLILNNKKNIYEATTMSHANSLGVSDALQLAKDQESNPEVIATYGQPQAIAMANMIRAQVKSRVQANNQNATVASQETSTLHQAAQNNPLSPLPEYLHQKNTNWYIANGKEATANLNDKEYSIDRQLFSTVEGNKISSESGYNEALQTLNTHLSNIKYDTDTGIYDRETTISAISKLNDYKRSFQNGKAVDMIQQTKGYQELLNKSISNNDVDPDTLDNYSINIQKNLGIPTSKLQVIPQGGASGSQSFISNWMSATPAGQSVMLSTLKIDHPANFPLVISQIQRESKGKISNLMTYLNVHNTPSSNPYLQQVFEASKTPMKDVQQNLKDHNTSYSDVHQDVMNEMSSTMNSFIKQKTYRPGMFSNTLDLATKLSSSFVSQGQSPKNAAKNAANIVFNYHHNVSNINGGSFSIPTTDLNGNKVDQERAKAILKLTMKKSFENNLITNPSFKQGSRLSDDQIDDEYKTFNRIHSHWVNTSDGLTLVDSNGQAMQRKIIDPITGNPELNNIGKEKKQVIMVPSHVLTDPNSDQNKMLNEEIVNRSKKFSSQGFGFLPKNLSPDFAINEINNESLFSLSNSEKEKVHLLLQTLKESPKQLGVDFVNQFRQKGHKI